MTDQQELDWMLEAFFVQGTDELADRVLDEALDEIDHTHQRRRSAVTRRFNTMSMPARLAAAAVIGVLVVGGTLFLWNPFSSSSVGVSPPASANPPPVASPSVATPRVAWTTTGSRAHDWASYSATTLADGRVLVVGGADPNGQTSTAEIYDPARGSWLATEDMAYGRALPAAAGLPGGLVLVVGSNSGGAGIGELFDPTTGTWSATKALVQPRHQPSSIAMPDGRVLVVGGAEGPDLLPSAEIYDPAKGTWKATGPMQVGRANAALAVLWDGRILAIGGFAGNEGTSLQNTVEIYDPATDSWSPTGSMHVNCVFAATLTLRDGRVLIVGGERRASADIYDPVSGAWTETGPVPAQHGNSLVAVAMPDGSVLVTGGGGSAARLDPSTGMWTDVASGPQAGYVRSATTLSDGRTLVVEGTTPDGGGFAPSELFDPRVP